MTIIQFLNFSFKRSTMSLSKKIKSEAKTNNWLQKAKERKANQDWLDISFKIATKILRYLRESGMTQKDLAQKLDCSPQYLSKILKGKENFTIETISRIQNIIKVQLIQVPEFSFAIEYDSDLLIKKSHPLKVDDTKLFFQQELPIEYGKFDEVSALGNTQYAMAA